MSLSHTLRHSHFLSPSLSLSHRDSDTLAHTFSHSHTLSHTYSYLEHVNGALGDEVHILDLTALHEQRVLTRVRVTCLSKTPRHFPEIANVSGFKIAAAGTPHPQIQLLMLNLPKHVRNRCPQLESRVVVPLFAQLVNLEPQ